MTTSENKARDLADMLSRVFYNYYQDPELSASFIYSSVDPTKFNSVENKILGDRLISAFCETHGLNSSGVMNDYHLRSRFEELVIASYKPAYQKTGGAFVISTDLLRSKLQYVYLAGLLEKNLIALSLESVRELTFSIPITCTLLREVDYRSSGTVNTIASLLDAIIEHHDLFLATSRVDLRKDKSVQAFFHRTVKITNCTPTRN